MSEPTYLLWTPRITETEAEVRFNVTAMSAVLWPSEPPEFYEQLLTDIGVEAEVESWQVLPYRSRYHGDPEAGDWRDRWKRNWRVAVRCSSAPEAGRPFEEGYETSAFSAGSPVPDGDEIHALVLADFPDAGKAESAREEIAAALEGPAFELFPVEGTFWQLQVDLGAQPSSFFAESAEPANRVEEICRQHDGWPTFDERIAVLG